MSNQYEGEETLVNRKLDVILHRGENSQDLQCRTFAVGQHSLLLDGIIALSPRQAVQVTLAADSDQPLTLSCRVEATAGSHAYLYFDTLSPSQQQRLNEVLWPTWDGANLLDGLLLMAERYGATSLTEWLRLTDLLSVWHPQVTKRLQRD